MRKTLTLFLFLALSFLLSAQTQRGLRGTFNLEKFPKVTFVWNTPNPDTLDVSRFALLEDNIPVEFNLSMDSIDIDHKIIHKKSILFLWEDMANHGRQSDFARELLTQFFTLILNDSSITDSFEVAVFNRQKGNSDTVLKPLVGFFTNDDTLLCKAVSTYMGNGRYYSSKQSDLYQAINEGIEMLKKEPIDRTGVIIVITAGLSTKGSITEMSVRQNALAADIPIYVVHYPLKGEAQEIYTLAEKTFGLVATSTDASEAIQGLWDNYCQLDNRLNGLDYAISFTSNCERDSKQHTVQFMVDKVQQFQLSYEAPEATIGMWLGKHWWLVVVIVLLIGGGTVLVVLLAKKKKAEKEEASENLQNQIRREREESERRHSEEIEALRREQQAKIHSAEEIARRERDAANEERLEKMMHTKNLLPRLKYKCGKESCSYTITIPRVTLGRDSNNDIILDNPSVSRQHAEIVFDGSVFEVINRSHSYTQGIVVNGQLCQKSVIKNGDMIGLGEVIISFYL